MAHAIGGGWLRIATAAGVSARPAPCFPPLRNFAAAFLSAADHTARRQAATRPGITALTVLATTTVGLAAMPAVLATMAISGLPTVTAIIIPLTQAVALATPPATPAVSVALLAHTAPRSMSLVARVCLGRAAATQPTPARTVPPHHHHHTHHHTHHTRTTTRTTPPQAPHAPPHAQSHTNQRCTRAQGRGRTFVTLPAPLRRARALRVRPAPHHSTSIAPAKEAAKPTTPSAIRV